ncbi:hypothetical protein SmJEL517_g02175 [Synchytrium microbalum]|uniref:polynucleotide adenylyltransferase n=1 Tax=Synchytrium microbalum TaxID=1806994 RepID=A0A507C2Z2_9FUNG|nr:uncharacterized protein SmJEL517_g02175 [Synchytrium microbalum]TPX35497.1 hypothetical protein SmJEL517_g02175 [Synchytrium microbalum]
MNLDLSIPSKPKGIRFAYLEWELASDTSHATNGEDTSAVSDDGFESTASTNSLLANTTITFKPLHPPLPQHLTTHQETQLTEQVLDLYNTLRPRDEFKTARMGFLEKLQGILDNTWPDHSITAYLFGSSINGLGTESSDVDICLVTPWEDLENGVANVHVFANAMRRNKMQNVYTISKAKVPICKFYDPIFNVNCDVNINNTLALRNTEFIKAYVELDDRVRPLLLVLKHWTKQRDLNDAVKGGTLSSYCWVQMFLNFLQTRNPPILPSLQKLYLDQLRNGTAGPPKMEDGVDCSFYSDLDSLKDFGHANTESLGALLYTFFRKFAVEFDYDTHVISVRCGCYLTKEEKGWNMEMDRMCRHLCIEEPFTTTRNLANSADATTVVGLRWEFETAAHILSTSVDLDAVCQKYTPKISSRSPMTYSTDVYGNGIIVSSDANGMLPAAALNGNGPHKMNGTNGGHYSNGSGKSRGGQSNNWRNNNRNYHSSNNGYGYSSYPSSYYNSNSYNFSQQQSYAVSYSSRQGMSPSTSSQGGFESGTSPDLPNSPMEDRRNAATNTERRVFPAEYHGTSNSNDEGRQPKALSQPREYPEYNERVFDEFGIRDYGVKDYRSTNGYHGGAKSNHDRRYETQKPPTQPQPHHQQQQQRQRSSSSQHTQQQQHQQNRNHDRQDRRNYSSSPVPVVALEHRGTQTGGLGMPPSRPPLVNGITSPTLAAGVSRVDGRSEFVMRDEVRESATQTPSSPSISASLGRTSPAVLPTSSLPLHHQTHTSTAFLSSSMSSTASSASSSSATPNPHQWADVRQERRASAPQHSMDVVAIPPSPDTYASATTTSSESPPPIEDSPCPSPEDNNIDAPSDQPKRKGKAMKKGVKIWSNSSQREAKQPFNVWPTLPESNEDGSNSGGSSQFGGRPNSSHSTTRSRRHEIRDHHRHPHQNSGHPGRGDDAGNRKRSSSVPPSQSPRDPSWTLANSAGYVSGSVTPAGFSTPPLAPILPRPESYRDALERGRYAEMVSSNIGSNSNTAVVGNIVPTSESFALDEETVAAPVASDRSNARWNGIFNNSNSSNGSTSASNPSGGNARRNGGSSYRGTRGGGRGKGGKSRGGGSHQQQQQHQNGNGPHIAVAPSPSTSTRTEQSRSPQPLLAASQPLMVRSSRDRTVSESAVLSEAHHGANTYHHFHQSHLPHVMHIAAQHPESTI